MSRGAIKENEIAQRYGGVLFDLGSAEKSLPQLLKEAERVEVWLDKNRELWEQVVSPVVALSVQQKIIMKLITSLKLSDLMGHFFQVMCQNRRLPNLEAVLENLMARSKIAEGKLEGHLETATKISQKEILEIEGAFKKALGKKVSFEQVINKNLLAGIVIHLESWKIDASLKSTLNKLTMEMKG